MFLNPSIHQPSSHLSFPIVTTEQSIQCGFMHIYHHTTGASITKLAYITLQSMLLNSSIHQPLSHFSIVTIEKVNNVASCIYILPYKSIIHHLASIYYISRHAFKCSSMIDDRPANNVVSAIHHLDNGLLFSRKLSIHSRSYELNAWKMIPNVEENDEWTL